MMTQNSIKLGRLQSAVLAVVAATGVAYAGTSSVVQSSKGPGPTPDPEPEDKEFFLCTFLDDYTKLKFDNDFINYIDLKGRYQGQYFWVDADQGSEDDYETRRLRLGLEVGFLDKGEIWYEFNVGTDAGLNDDDQFYKNVDNYGIEWEFSKAAKLQIGKIKPKITHEYATSSRKILTLERSAIVNTVAPEKSLGINLSGKLEGGYKYSLGVYSGDLGDEYEHGDFGAGFGILASFGTKIKGLSDKSDVRFDYFYQDGDEGNDGFAPYEHIFSLNSRNKWGNFGLDTDLIYAISDEANNSDRGDVWGVILIPHYDFTDNFQIVGRYQYYGGDGADSTRLYSRYQRRVASDGGRGEDQHSFYVGLNYYICSHAAKLMAGVEYTTQDGSGDGGDYDGFQYLVGVRTYW